MGPRFRWLDFAHDDLSPSTRREYRRRLDPIRRVQNETMGHRGRKDDPPCRCRRVVTKTDGRLADHGRTRLLGAGDPGGEVRMAWHAKEVVRSLDEHTDPDPAGTIVEHLGHDLPDASCPVEGSFARRTLLRWQDQIAAWHQAHVSNGPTEAATNLIKRVKRVAFGFTRWRNYRILVLLYAGRPNWDLLPAVTPHVPSRWTAAASRSAMTARSSSPPSSSGGRSARNAGMPSPRARSVEPRSSKGYSTASNTTPPEQALHRITRIGTTPAVGTPTSAC